MKYIIMFNIPVLQDLLLVTSFNKYTQTIIHFKYLKTITLIIYHIVCYNSLNCGILVIKYCKFRKLVEVFNKMQ